MKSRELNECSLCGKPLDNHKMGNFKESLFSTLARRGGAYCPPDGKTSFVPVVVWELSEAEVKLLKEAKK